MPGQVFDVAGWLGELGLERPADCTLASTRVPPLRGVREVLARQG